MCNLIWVPFIIAVYTCYLSWKKLLIRGYGAPRVANCPLIWLSVISAAPVIWLFSIMLVVLALHGFDMANTALGTKLCGASIICLVISSIGCRLNTSIVSHPIPHA